MFCGLVRRKFTFELSFKSSLTICFRNSSNDSSVWKMFWDNVWAQINLGKFLQAFETYVDWICFSSSTKWTHQLCGKLRRIRNFAKKLCIDFIHTENSTYWELHIKLTLCKAGLCSMQKQWGGLLVYNIYRELYKYEKQNVFHNVNNKFYISL